MVVVWFITFTCFLNLKHSSSNFYISGWKSQTHSIRCQNHFARIQKIEIVKIQGNLLTFQSFHLQKPLWAHYWTYRNNEVCVKLKLKSTMVLIYQIVVYYIWICIFNFSSDCMKDVKEMVALKNTDFKIVKLLCIHFVIAFNLEFPALVQVLLRSSCILLYWLYLEGFWNY